MKPTTSTSTTTPTTTTTSAPLKCPENITKEVKDPEITVSVSWLMPVGSSYVPMHLDAPAGMHNYNFPLPDGTKCNFVISVTGSLLLLTVPHCAPLPSFCFTAAHSLSLRFILPPAVPLTILHPTTLLTRPHCASSYFTHLPTLRHSLIPPHSPQYAPYSTSHPSLICSTCVYDSQMKSYNDMSNMALKFEQRQST